MCLFLLYVNDTISVDRPKNHPQKIACSFLFIRTRRQGLGSHQLEENSTTREVRFSPALSSQAMVCRRKLISAVMLKWLCKA